MNSGGCRVIDVNKNLLLKHPFTMMIAGATSSGKTFLSRKIVESLRELTTTDRETIRVLWCYGVYQPLYSRPFDVPGLIVEFHEGLPDDLPTCDLLVIDDLMSSLGSDKRLSDIFTKGSHHANMSVIFIVQNVFHQGKQMRNITLNSHYLILTKSRRDLAQMKTLGTQLFSKAKFFTDVYKRAVLDPDYGYLLIDLTASTSEKNRLRSNITPDEFPVVIWEE